MANETPEASTATQRKKIERGRRSPTHPLNESISLLRQIRTSLGDGPFGRAGIADALGHQQKSGALSTKIGSLTHFGLLSREGNVYRVSPIGSRVLFPQSEESRTKAIAEAARAPSLYDEVITTYEGKALPTLFKNVLIQNYGVAAGGANDVAECFRQSMEFAGLLRHGVLHAKPASSNSGSPDESEEHTMEEAEHTNSQRLAEPTREALANTSKRAEAFSIPLSKGRVATIHLSRPLDDADHQRILAWLALMRDVLLENEGGES